ncbi:hypothetical protein [Sphingomonas sp. 28-63-12]|uniref:hypothetical protein n=1 Tax=Sphingomonas sp. 28-63-12 TaxID=1970434 RepID=UPI000BCF9A14|nr:MAG: hypothetical protein B7Y47_08065 [Sphingomonas sp. 28-63-12]
MKAIADLLEAARAARAAGNLPSAITQQSAAIELLRAGTNPLALAHALRHRADMLIGASRAAEAEPDCAQALWFYAQVPEAPPLDIANAVRCAACQAEAVGDTAGAIALWRDARTRYARLTDLFTTMTGSPANPGVAEATMRIEALGGV